jgi:F420-0:gamma-glutamyl ligase
MKPFGISLALAMSLAFSLASATTVAAEQPDVVVVTATVQGACEGLERKESLRVAREASDNGAHARAAECYRAAGDNLRAHRSLIRVAEETAATAKQSGAAARQNAKAQMKRIKDALR